jgi:hypothetical protein
MRIVQDRLEKKPETVHLTDATLAIADKKCSNMAN